MKKERWTESEVVSLPSGEHDYFERKSGAFLKDAEFREKLAKAVSAFANSGGGHLVIGVQDPIDGVPKIHKGRTTTRDWLEQTVPHLVTYPLQNFRVHEVEPDTVSAIPTDQVVIVIDIGDSMQAPHQSAVTKIYHYRAGGRSERAPHHFLEILRGREKYPSQKIAHAWLNFVIAPLLNTLRYEEENLINPKQPWHAHQMSTGDTGYFVALSAGLSANEMQFFKFYPTIKEALGDHDRAINRVQAEVEALIRTIASSGLMAQAYSRFLTSEYLQRIRETYGNRLDREDTDEKMLRNLFGDRSDSDRIRSIAEFMVYDYPQRWETHFIWPLWQTYKNDLMEFLRYPPIREQQDEIKMAQKELLLQVKALSSVLEETQHELAFKYGEPYEDSTLQLSLPGQSSLL
jgi:hypothetical protein